ncbi:MAG: AI-2E family transporter [Gammaproteobacteria bacterium]|nr:AI-2E family transporter [Gammaproteobacteria bacterium]
MVFASLIIIAAGIKAAEDLMVPFLLAAFIATIAATPVFWLEKHKVPAAVSITLVMAAMVVMVIGVGAVVAQSAGAFTAKLPFYQARLVEIVEGVLAVVEPLGVKVSDELLLSYFDPGTALVMAGNTLRGLGGVLSNSFLILLTVIFILAEASSFPRKLGDVLSDPEHDLPHFARFADNVNRYMAIKTTISVVTGLIVAIFLTIMGVDFPVLWGLLAFLLNYVPTIGSFIAAIPAILLALIQLGPLPAAIVAAGYFTVNIVMGNAVEPRFMGRGLGLSTLVVFLSLVFWGWMLGPVGMLLSVPLTMTAKIALEASPSSAWLASLLGPADKPAPKSASAEAPA